MVDLNPLHYVSKFNHMFGDSVASGLEFLGISDPAVDPDGVREIAKKWRSLATGLDDEATAAERSLRGMEWEGTTAKEFGKRSKAARKQATEMAHALREGAKALDDFADKAHELLSEIGVMLAEIVEFEIAGLALSVLTAGASDVAATLMAGERALKVVALVGRIEEEGTALGTAVRGIMEVIRGVERALKALKEIRGVAAVAKMAKEGVTFTAFSTLLEDPGAFKDPEKLAGILAEGAAMGVGFGVLGKALGKGLKALGPAALAGLSKSMGLDCAAFERLRLNPGFDKLPASIRNVIKTFVRDPIDVATGDMVMPRTDVSLPGVLPLVLERTHISSYRFGGWFGPSWASTLDQRVQADEEGFVYAAADGARLCFPPLDPASADPVHPLTPGSRLALSWDEETDGAIRVTDPDTGLVTVFHSPVAAAGETAVDLPLQHITDRNGNRITVVYEQGDIPATVVHSGGYRIALDHDPARSRITGLRLVDPTRPERPGTTLLGFGYDELGRLVEETNSSGRPMRYAYDAEGRVTSWTDRNDTTYWYRYDDRGRVVATGGTGGALASTLGYDETARTTRVTDSLGHTRVYEHNASLRLVRETDPLGNSVSQEWDDRLRLRRVVDQTGRSTELGYDSAGDLATVVRADGTETAATYNALGLVETVTDPDGSTWRNAYDERGNRVAVTEPNGATTRFTYNRSGHLTSFTDALGHTTVVRGNPAGLPLRIQDPLGNVTSYERDAFGRTVAIIDPARATTRLEWTVEGQPTRRTTPDGNAESWEYDGEENPTVHIGPTGATTSFEYGCFDLLAARVDPDGTRYEYAYDTELRLTQVRNPAGRAWRYAFDAAGRMTSETDFDGRTLRYALDAAGRLIARSNALGQEIRLDRDALGQVVRKDVHGLVTTYAYDAAGRLVRAVGPDSSVNRQFDLGGNLTAETVDGRTTSYTYDERGRRSSRATPSGAVSAYGHDAADNLVSLVTAGGTIGFEHDAVGRERTRRVGASVTMLTSYDVMGRLSRQEIADAAGHVVQERGYSYRADGYLEQLDDRLNGSRRMTLDVMGRVNEVRAEGWTERYAYDETGNLTAAQWPETHPGHEAVGPRVYEGGRITHAGRVRYEHDAQGRITLRQKARLSRKPDTWRYTWDAEDRLVGVVTPDGTLWRYLYDALGRRTSKQRFGSDGTTVVERVDFAWDGSTLCEQTTTVGGSPHHVTLTWDHDGLLPLAQSERTSLVESPQEEIDARFYAIVTDLVGSPTELLDEEGAVVWRTRSTLWGKAASTANGEACVPLRFPGQYHDPETDLHYNYFRYYDPESARYLTPDPLGLLPAPNPSTYVHNPQTWSDPLGLAPRCRELGLRAETMDALRKLENIKKDPLGEINSQPNHNHYNAARLEAQGQVVARKANGTPFNHIQELKEARSGLDNVRMALEKEIRNPPESITDRGMEVLLKKRKETIEELDRLNGFLHSIGHR
ncbi:polymorphic toxin type 28 domain-containing protein [Streptomyces sp. NPDC093970]|uniref:polymorphic toxin type 28 domain-containing protein n=1 Tax=Streptomyces sp. NPDC093970 TaxID=3155076 RepID=UPI00342340D2